MIGESGNTSEPVKRWLVLGDSANHWKHSSVRAFALICAATLLTGMYAPYGKGSVTEVVIARTEVMHLSRYATPFRWSMM